MTEQTTTVTNDDGVTITFDPRVIAQGARVRFATAVATRHSGSDDDVTVPPGALGTVLEYVDGFYQCIVRLDAPLRDTSRRDVWASPDDLGIVPDRFAFDRDARRADPRQDRRLPRGRRRRRGPRDVPRR